MPCSSNNPCFQPTCNDCGVMNPCYENCGCLNPTTFQCITNTEDNYTHIPLNTSQTGQEFLIQLNQTIGVLKDNQYKVKSDDSDTCPDTLFDKLEAGNENISITVSGSGCDRKLILSVADGIGTLAPDIHASVSENDTNSDYLGNKFTDGTYVKKAVVNPGGDEKIKFDLTPSSLISTDSGNQLTVGIDGKLKTSFSIPDGTETKINVVPNSGITISGTGSNLDPYILGSNGAIFRKSARFDGEWRTLTLSSGNPSVTINSQNVAYRLRYDGTVEYKGNVSFAVVFTTANKIGLNIGAIPTVGSTNLTAAEIDRSVDLKSIMMFDVPSTINAAPTLYGYLLRQLSGGTIYADFTSSTSGTKNIVMTFDSAQYHPNV